MRLMVYRYTTVMLSNELLITCVYLPCHNSSIAYTVELSAICAHLESILDKHVIILWLGTSILNATLPSRDINCLIIYVLLIT